MNARHLLLGAVAVPLALVACAGDRPDGAAASSAAIEAHAEVCAAGLTGFQAEFLPHVRQEVCANCHTGANPNAPPWLKGRDEQIYLSVKNYVNFSNLPNSRILVRAGNGHCGPGCNADMARRMKEYLEHWSTAGEQGCDQATSLLTQPQAVPADLPSDRFVTLSWDLRNVDVTLRGVSLAIDIRKFSNAAGPTPGSYMLRKPRFVSASPIPLAVEKIRILNNLRLQDAANQFERVHAVVAPDVSTGPTLQYPVLSPEPMILVEDQPGADQLVVGFEHLSRSGARPCTAMDQFSSKVMPIVEARDCRGCHSPGPSADVAASTRFDMSGDAAALCAKFLGRTWTDADVLPALIQFPLLGRFDHPRTFVSADKVLPGWTDWIAAEWQ